MTRVTSEDIGPAFEVLVAVFLAALAAAAVASFLRVQMKKADEGVLRAQLRALRSQQRLFTAVHGRPPSDMLELINDAYSLFPMGAEPDPRQPSAGLLTREAVMAAAADSSGYPVDPWGNRFALDPATGAIRSRTAGYEDW